MYDKEDKEKKQGYAVSVGCSPNSPSIVSKAIKKIKLEDYRDKIRKK